MLQNSLGYVLIIPVSGPLQDYSKIKNGMLHVATVIHLIFFCLFPAKLFHSQGKNNDVIQFPTLLRQGNCKVLHCLVD